MRSTIIANRLFRTQRFVMLIIVSCFFMMLLVLSITAHKHIKEANFDIYDKTQSKINEYYNSINHYWGDEGTDSKIESNETVENPDAEAVSGSEAGKAVEDSKKGNAGTEEGEVEAKPKVGAGVGAEPKVEDEPTVETEVEAEDQAGAQVEAQVEGEPKVEAQVEGEPKVEAEFDAGTGASKDESGDVNIALQDVTESPENAVKSDKDPDGSVMDKVSGP
ncbi:hypothetical protein CLIB1444_10S04192 [[Candida] jaroonii]|uniref:Uncharacterized protein n=1 Tax=[Candida] jaroonii TaxID=467808 RepID=A0ACA9YD84_9ASCO|nr:hypothetical protein CLIB1444_10S04192 [[Candida] jaroonii]